MVHDFEKQQNSTFQIWLEIHQRNGAKLQKIDLDLHFLPNESDANTHELEQSLINLSLIHI